MRLRAGGCGFARKGGNLNIFGLCWRPFGRLTLLTAVAAVAVAACDMPEQQALNQSALTPAEQDLQAKTEQQRQVDSALTGAAAGAIGGAVLGYLIGGWQGAATGAITGGMAGAAIGVGYGSYMNAKARSYANDEARANAVAQGADQTLAYYQQVNNSGRVILAEQEQKIAKLNDDYKSRAITKEKFQQEFASSSLDQKNLNQQLQGIDKQLAEMRGDPQSGMLAARINSLQAERDTLKGTYDKLLELYGTVPAEVRVGTS